MKLLTILLAPIVAVGMASTALARDYKDLRLFFAPCAYLPKSLFLYWRCRFCRSGFAAADYNNFDRYLYFLL
jgi:hypothetical protein